MHGFGLNERRCVVARFWSCLLEAGAKGCQSNPCVDCTTSLMSNLVRDHSPAVLTVQYPPFSPVPMVPFLLFQQILVQNAHSLVFTSRGVTLIRTNWSKKKGNDGLLLLANIMLSNNVHPDLLPLRIFYPSVTSSYVILAMDNSHNNPNGLHGALLLRCRHTSFFGQGRTFLSTINGPFKNSPI